VQKHPRLNYISRAVAELGLRCWGGIICPAQCHHMHAFICITCYNGITGPTFL